MGKCNPLLLTTGLTHSLDSTEYGRAFFDSYSFGCLKQYHRKILAYKHKPMSVYVDLGYKKSLERQERNRIRQEQRKKERCREMERLRRIRKNELKKQEEARERRRLKRLQKEQEGKAAEQGIIEEMIKEQEETANREYHAILDDICKKIVWQYRRGNR